MDNETILILVTGGTFDKEYDELSGQLFFKETHVPEMLRLGRCRAEIRVETLMLLDSLELDDERRALIRDKVRETPERRIIITHGTDTMPETARFLGREEPGKTVVLTGAMVPYKFGSSDGLFNLGAALGFVQVLPSGVYIAMNGRCFDWHNVRKNRDHGIFVHDGASYQGSASETGTPRAGRAKNFNEL